MSNPLSILTDEELAMVLRRLLVAGLPRPVEWQAELDRRRGRAPGDNPRHSRDNPGSSGDNPKPSAQLPYDPYDNPPGYDDLPSESPEDILSRRAGQASLG